MNNPLDFVWNVEHGKQSRIRPFRMPALPGMLLCAAGLRALPRKALSQRQGINRPSGVMCVRPLVGFLSAVVTAILLCASNHADAQSQPAPMVGLFFLENADPAGQPAYKWDQDKGLTNPLVQGIAMRTH